MQVRELLNYGTAMRMLRVAILIQVRELLNYGVAMRMLGMVMPNQLTNAIYIALIPNPSPEGEGSQSQSPSPLGRGI